MDRSLKQMKQIPDELLEERIENVKSLKETDKEAYEIVKDKLTGEHYIHYSAESFHHLLPIDNDEVLSLLFDQPDYSYPEHWKQAFLRNGPDGHYVWFDPSYAEDFESSVKLGKGLKEKLDQFKQAGNYDQESMQKLLTELDELRNDKDE